MPRVIAISAIGILIVLAVLYLTGADLALQVWALAGQQAAQNAIASALRALRTGEPAALVSLLAVCFGYGFFHAVGPGHGKLLIGGYGAAAQVGAVKLSLVALASSLAQALTAIVLVGAGLLLLGWGRTEMTGLAEDLFAPLSFAAIALIGLWLLVRGLRGLRALRTAQDPGPSHDHGHDPHHHHDHGPGAVCDTCGHAHMPTPESLVQAQGWRDIAALIAAVAIRPCTGALFLLILTAQMSIFAAGVAGTVAMALGTASVTVAVAISAVSLRRGVLMGLTNNAALARAQPILEIAVGALVAIVAGQFAIRLL